MHWAERVLLYAVTVVLGGLLLFDGPAKSPAAGSSAASMATNGRDSLPLFNSLSEQSAGRTLQASERFVLTDRSGRVRLELRIDANGVPAIELKDAAGAPVIQLIGDGTNAEISLRQGNRRAAIVGQSNGDLSVELSANGSRARLALSSQDEAEVSVAGKSGVGVRMRTNREGSADLAIHRSDGTAGPLMSLLPTGDAGISVRDPHGAGPVMQLFTDGLAEVCINSPDTYAGPSMLRLPDGVCSLSIRLPSGQPAASMVVSPTGEAVIAAANEAGDQQAALRVDASGMAGLILPDPKQPVIRKPVPQRPPVRRLPRPAPTASRDPDSDDRIELRPVTWHTEDQ